MSRILVIGDAMIDRYWLGDATRLSPDAPVPVVAVTDTEDRPGAAANVALNIEAMGGDVVTLFSPTFKTDPVVKVRILGRGRHVVRADFDRPQEPIDMGEYRRLLKDSQIVVISDYGKGALKNIVQIVSDAVQVGAMVLVDPKGYRYEKYRGASVVKPNLEEMRQLVGGWESEDELEHKVNAMRMTAGIESILLTRGAAGMTLYNGHRTDIQAHAVKPVDVSGAGEAAISALAVGVAEGMDLAEASHFANKAAGLAVQRFGTTVLTRAEVLV